MGEERKACTVSCENRKVMSQDNTRRFLGYLMTMFHLHIIMNNGRQ